MRNVWWCFCLVLLMQVLVGLSAEAKETEIDQWLKNPDFECDYEVSPTLVKNTLDYCLGALACKDKVTGQTKETGTIACKAIEGKCPAVKECVVVKKKAKVAVQVAAVDKSVIPARDKKERSCRYRTPSPRGIWVEWMDESEKSQMIPFCATPITCDTPIPNEPPPTFAVCDVKTTDEKEVTDGYPKIVCPPVNNCLNDKSIETAFTTVIERKPNSSELAAPVPLPHAQGNAYNAPQSSRTSSRPRPKNH